MEGHIGYINGGFQGVDVISVRYISFDKHMSYVRYLPVSYLYEISGCLVDVLF